MNDRDARGYYARLDVPPSASDADVKAAFRRKAKELHPDHNSSPRASEEFRHLEEAYAALRDPTARAQYDALGLETQEGSRLPSEEVTAEPLACSSCGRVTAQPRYIILFEVKSFLVVTFRTPIQGIFCPACAEKKALRASVVTWLLGWWGFPWGLIYSPHALFWAFLGGRRPADVNARVLAYQAWVFARNGQIDLARAIASDAADFAAKIKDSSQRDEMQRSTRTLLDAMHDGRPIKRLKRRWSVMPRVWAIQGVFLVGILIWSQAATMAPTARPTPTSMHRPPPTPMQPAVSYPATPPAAARPTQQQLPFDQPALNLPPNGVYRRYWRDTPGEILAPLAVTAPDAGFHYFVKIVDWSLGTAVLTVFVRSGHTIEVELPIGNYRVRYASGATWYGPKHLFGPSTAYGQADKKFDLRVEGDKVAGYTISLARRVGGNLQVTAISAEDF